MSRRTEPQQVGFVGLGAMGRGAVADRHGLPLDLTLEILNSGAAGSWMLADLAFLGTTARGPGAQDDSAVTTNCETIARTDPAPCMARSMH